MLCGTVTFPESDALWNDGCGAYANHNRTMLRNESAWCLIIQWRCWICKHSSSDKLRVLILKNTHTRSSHLTQKVPCTSVAALAWTQATLVIELCGPGISLSYFHHGLQEPKKLQLSQAERKEVTVCPNFVFHNSRLTLIHITLNNWKIWRLKHLHTAQVTKLGLPRPIAFSLRRATADCQSCSFAAFSSFALQLQLHQSATPNRVPRQVTSQWIGTLRKKHHSNNESKCWVALCCTRPSHPFPQEFNPPCHPSVVSSRDKSSSGGTTTKENVKKTHEKHVLQVVWCM